MHKLPNNQNLRDMPRITLIEFEGRLDSALRSKHTLGHLIFRLKTEFTELERAYKMPDSLREKMQKVEQREARPFDSPR